MKAKQIFIGDEGRNAVVSGINQVYLAVASTLGPYGATAIIENDIRKDNPPGVTKDGVSVAGVINLPGQLEQLGAKLVLQASTQADTKSGDGTTTTVVLTQGLLARALEMHSRGMLPIQVRAAIQKSVEGVIEQLELAASKHEVTAETIRCVARISANGEERLADVAIAAVESAKGGPVTIRSHREETDEVEVLHGAIIPGSPLTLDLLDRNSKVTNFDRPNVCIYNGRFSSSILSQLANYTESNKGGVCVVIVKDIADGIEEQVASLNRRRNVAPIQIVAAPGAGQQRQRYLNALSAMVGAAVVEPGQDLVFGEAASVQMEINRTSLIPNENFAQSDLIDKLLAERGASSIGSIKYKQFDEILRFVLGRRVTVYVGGMTQADIKERQDRMVDAVHAIEAVRDGVIPGGGTVLAMVDDGADNLFADAYSLPFRKILLNGGLTEDAVARYLDEARNLAHESGSYYTPFFDILRDEYVDLVNCDTPVYDPVRVTINALRAAAQVVITVITSNCYIIED